MHENYTLWGAFFAIVLILLVLDLGLFHRHEREIGIRESLLFSGFYIAVSLCFALFVYFHVGRQEGKDFFTGYIIEKSLSMDNVFAISMVFHYFSIPRTYQHPVLFWGVIGVILLRGLMIGVGTILIHAFAPVMYVFGFFLLIVGVRMLFTNKKEKELAENKLLHWLESKIKVTKTLHGRRFFIREKNYHTGTLIRKATPLFLTLIFIEIADIIFAIDSVPAVFAVTTDTFIVYSSNIFAILGLRALYFTLSAMLSRFTYLQYALALVLIFIGGKIFAPLILGISISSTISLLVTFILLGSGVALSLYKTRQ